ncbi:unnamed protein product [Prorocentrum cordatum]|uniref:Calcium-activated potassium channel subunit alpha-1 n=1 Tax=Prorocentrum cordatum TaxID=2364126 RepID=A0ABN9V2L5_9DINO|nr:unnamed protein product [Polarella glacialis]
MAVCRTNCGPEHWDYIASLVYITIGLWLFLGAIGIFWLFLANTSSLDRFREKVGLTHARMSANSLFCLVDLALSMAICVLYVRRTYTHSYGTFDLVVETLACAMYLSDLIPDFIVKNLTSASSGVKMLCTRAVPDCIIVASMLSTALIEVDGRTTWASWSFFASWRATHAWKRLLHVYNVNIQMKEWQVADSVVSAISMVFAAAMLMMSLENLGDPSMMKDHGRRDWNIVSAMYFVVTTISTVGYGDMAPRTGIGRIVAIVAIFGGIAMVLLVTSKMVQVFSQSSHGLGSWQPMLRSKHIIVTGNPTTQMVKEFMSELFHPDHDDDSEDLHLVFLLPKGSATLSELIRFLELKRNIGLAASVHPLGGSVLNRADLLRASAAYSSCFFVLPNTRNEDPRREDTESIIRAMAIQKSVANTRIILVLMKAEHRQMVLDAGMAVSQDPSSPFAGLTILAVDEFKMEVIGKTCAIPGFSTFMSNLCTSVTVSDEDKELGRGARPKWQQEYESGLGMELYEVELSLLYASRQAVFIEVVVDVLEQTGGTVYLIGLVEQTLNGKRVLINPGPNYKIRPPSEHVETSGIFMAPNREAVLQCEGGMVFLGRRERALRDQRVAKAVAKQPGWSHLAEDEVGGLAIPGVPAGMAEKARKVIEMVHKHRRAKVAKRPPMKMLGSGGHVLVLCLGGSVDSQGMQVGLGHLVKPLRRHLEFLGGNLKPIVIMAAATPLDWPAVEDTPGVYFLQGDPMVQFDLERTSFRDAAAIVVCQVGTSGASTATKEPWTVDSSVISCVRAVESQLNFDRRGVVVVIAALYCDTNHFLVPRALQEKSARKKKRQEGMSVFAAMKDFRGRQVGFKMGQDGSKKEESEIAGPDVPYYRTARYARGQLFVDTTLTSLAVNTFYNPSLCELVSAMISAPMSRWQVSTEWVTKSFFELFDHLLWVEQLLAVALFREQGGVPYLFTAPPGKETTILTGDLVVCFGCTPPAGPAPDGAREQPKAGGPAAAGGPAPGGPAPGAQHGGQPGHGALAGPKLEPGAPRAKRPSQVGPGGQPSPQGGAFK